MADPAPSSDAPLILSISGARGIVGQTMTPAAASEFAAAFGSFIKSTTGVDHPLLCIGRDSRPSGEMLAAAAIAGLTAAGCRVIDLGLVATPTVAVMIGRHSADAGMVITASHNPILWNGLKCLTADGLAPPKADTEEIIRRFTQKDIDYAPVQGLPSPARDRTGNETHVAKVIVNVDSEAIREARFRVVLDSVNGAGCIAGRMLLEEIGCEVMHLNGEPTGMFAHTPEPIAENLADLCKAMNGANAACGFAQDPDADRLAIVDENGRYLGEEYTLVLAARRLLDLHFARGGGEVTVAANLSTSRMLDDLARQYDGVNVVRTAVGEANVAEAMKAAGTGALVGGEGNGGVIFPKICWVRDSLSAMALTLSLLAADPRKQPLSEIVDALPRYCMIKRKFDLTAIGGREAVDGIIEKVSGAFADEKQNTADGVRIDFTDGWVHLRPSNTEPIVRLIAEAQTEERAEELVEQAASVAGIA